MSVPAAASAGAAVAGRSRAVIVTALGVTQILAWGSSYYLPAVLAGPIAVDTGWSLGWVIGALSLGLLVEGLVAPYVGDAIEKRGGRPVLATSAVLLAAGLLVLAASPSLPFYFAGWIVIGFGMGAGLYDAAFSTLGRLYGSEARRAITLLTLFGGFASTVCWPLSALLVSEVGWRWTCLAYAALQLAVALPILLLALPREGPPAAFKATASSRPGGQAVVSRGRRTLLFALIAMAFTIATVIAAIVSVHLLTVLQARDIALATAVALGALIGPAQVGARVVEMLLGQRHHPIWTMMSSAVLIAAGVALLWAGSGVASLALVLYGAGMGIKSISRGTLPLAVFGAKGYASLMGRLVMPSLIAGAGAPLLAAVAIERYGVDAILAALTVAAVCNVGVVSALLLMLGSRIVSPASDSPEAG